MRHTLRVIVAALLALAWLVTAPALAAGHRLEGKPGQSVRTTLAKAQTAAPFLVRYPTYIPFSHYHSSLSVEFPPSSIGKQGFAVIIMYGTTREGVFVTDTFRRVTPAGGGVTYTRVDGRPAAVQVVDSAHGHATSTVDVYFPHTTCSLTGVDVTPAILLKMAASLQAE